MTPRILAIAGYSGDNKAVRHEPNRGPAGQVFRPLPDWHRPDASHVGQQVFVEGELRGNAIDGNQNPRVWTGNDGEARANYEVTARTVKFLGKREGNGAVPMDEPPPGGEDEDLMPF